MSPATTGNSDVPGRREGGTELARTGQTWELSVPGVERLVGSNGRKCIEEEKWVQETWGGVWNG